MIGFDINLLTRRWSYGFDINIGASSDFANKKISLARFNKSKIC
jgi:hypothetical protein